jgi:ABC-type antimicrobial peptide transport system permease subunit
MATIATLVYLFIASYLRGLQIDLINKLDKELYADILKEQKNGELVIRIGIMFAIFFGLSNILSIYIRNKCHQLGILKAIGLTKLDCYFILLLECVILCTIGLFIGYIFEFGIKYLFSHVFTFNNGKPLLSIYIDYHIVIRPIFVIISASAIAPVLAMYKTRNLNIIEVIQNE